MFGSIYDIYSVYLDNSFISRSHLWFRQGNSQISIDNSFPWTSITKYHKLDELNNRNILSQNSGGYESEIMVLAGLNISGGSEGKSVLCFSASVCWYAGNPWCSST